MEKRRIELVFLSFLVRADEFHVSFPIVGEAFVIFYVLMTRRPGCVLIKNLEANFHFSFFRSSWDVRVPFSRALAFATIKALFCLFQIDIFEIIWTALNWWIIFGLLPTTTFSIFKVYKISTVKLFFFLTIQFFIDTRVCYILTFSILIYSWTNAHVSTITSFE